MTHEESFAYHQEAGPGLAAVIASVGWPEPPAGCYWAGGIAVPCPTVEEAEAEQRYECERAVWLLSQCPGCEADGGAVSLCASCLAYVMDAGR